MLWHQKLWKVCHNVQLYHGVKKPVMTSKIWKVHHAIKKYVMSSKSMESMSWCQKVYHKVQKAHHNVKKYVMTPKVHHNVNKTYWNYIMISRSTSWRQKVHQKIALDSSVHVDHIGIRISAYVICLTITVVPQCTCWQISIAQVQLIPA